MIVTPLHYRHILKLCFCFMFLHNLRRDIVVLYCDMTVIFRCNFCIFLPLQLSTSINIMEHPTRTHRHHYITTTAAANTPPLPLILTSTILEQGQSFSFVVGGLIATSNHFFLDLPLNSKPPLKNGAPWQSTIIWAYYTDGSPPFSAPTASDNSIGPLRGRAWSLVPPTRRTTSTHHPLQLLTKWFMTPFCPQYSRNTDAAPPPTSPSTNIII